MSQNRSRGNAEPPHVQPKQGRAWIPCEMELPDFWDPTRSSRPFLFYCRSIFLDAVNRHAPQMLESLRTHVWKRLGPDTDQRELLKQRTEQHLKPGFHLVDYWLGQAAKAHFGRFQVFEIGESKASRQRHNTGVAPGRVAPSSVLLYKYFAFMHFPI